MRNRSQSVLILVGILLLVSTASSVSESIHNRDLASLFVLGYNPHDMARIRKDAGKNLGGIIWFRPNIKNRAQVQRDIAALKAVNPHLLVMVDQEGGSYNGFNDFDLPRPEAMTYMPVSEAFDRYSMTARKLKMLGFNINLVPVVDLSISQMPGSIARAGRSFGNDEAVDSQRGDFSGNHPKGSGKGSLVTDESRTE